MDLDTLVQVLNATNDSNNEIRGNAEKALNKVCRLMYERMHR